MQKKPFRDRQIERDDDVPPGDCTVSTVASRGLSETKGVRNEQVALERLQICEGWRR